MYFGLQSNTRKKKFGVIFSFDFNSSRTAVETIEKDVQSNFKLVVTKRNYLTPKFRVKILNDSPY